VTLTTQRFYFLHVFREYLTGKELYSLNSTSKENRHLGEHYYATRHHDGSVVIEYNPDECYNKANETVCDNDKSDLNVADNAEQDCNKRKLGDVDDDLNDGNDDDDDDLDDEEIMTICNFSYKKPKRDETLFDPRKLESVKLSGFKFQELLELYPKIENVCHELHSCVPCISDHHNQMSYFQCPECCPLNRDTYE
jgi:hypothetical protein